MISRFSMIAGLSLLLISTSCKNMNRGNDVDYAYVSDKTKFILMPDADSILDSWSKENVVINHWPADPDNLHPTNGKTTARSWILSMTSNFLLRSDPVNLSITPDLAVDFPDTSADKLQYTYRLRDDAKWDDGTPITSEDVIFSFKAGTCPLTNNPQAKTYLENIKDVVADGPYKVTMIMKKEYFLNVALAADYVIMERNFYDKNNVLSHYTIEQFTSGSLNTDNYPDLNAWANEFNDAKYGSDISMLNGSGPYKVISWTPKQTLVLERKKDHWTSKLKHPNVYQTSYPDKIVFRVVKDPNAQKLEFLSQSFDVSTWLSSETVMDLLQDPEFVKNYNVKFGDRYDYNYIGMNMQPDGVKHKKIFDDVKVRQAMAYLVPIDQIISSIAHGYAKRQASCVSPLKKDEYNTSLQLIPFDVEHAKQLLDEAGWKDTDGDNVRDKVIDGVKTPLRFEVKYQGGLKFADDMVKLIKESMYLAGVDIIPLPTDPNALSEELSNHDFDMYVGAWGGSSIPEDYSQLFATSEYLNNGSNFCGFGNAASDALLDSIKYVVDREKHIEMSKRFQKMVYDEQPYIFLYAAARKIVVHKRFGNQYMTFDRPGVLLNNLRLLSLYGSEEKNPQ